MREEEEEKEEGNRKAHWKGENWCEVLPGLDTGLRVKD